MANQKVGLNKEQNFELILRLFEHGVSTIQPKNLLGNFLSVNDKTIIIKDKLNKKIYKNINRIFVICIGKASVDMAITAKKILAKSTNKISKGIIVVNKENFKKISGFTCFCSGHPIPDSNGLKASKYIEKVLTNLHSKDLVLVLISGGGSAMLPHPVDKISLKDKIKMNTLLLESGANIKEINCVRKHLSKIKGGNLAKMCFPAQVHGLILSDVIGDDLGSIASGMTTFDNSKFSDVSKILKKYNLWQKTPSSVKNHVLKGINSKNLETPKKNNPIFINVKNTLIGSNYICLKNIQSYCRENKIKSKILFKNIDMDVKDFSKKFINKIKSLKFNSPTILISGGETTVKISGNGKGGRNQEFALHFLNEMKKKMPNKKFFLISAGTDGKDGPTDAAGGIVNHESLTKIKEKKINLFEELKKNNSYKVLKKIDSLVIIKSTNTNVADIQILLIP